MKVDLRLAIPAAVGWVTCGILIGASHAAVSVAMLMWAAAVCAALVGLGIRFAARASASRSRRVSVGRLLGVVCVCLAVGALGATSVATTSQVRRPFLLVDASAAHRQVEAIATVDSAPKRSTAPNFGTPTAREQFKAHVTAAQVSAVALTGAVPVLIFAPTVDGAAARLAIGDRVRVRGTVQALAEDSTTAFMLYATTPPSRIERAPPWLSWANSLRASFSKAAGTLPGDGGALLPGLAIGDVGAISPQLDAAMKQSSLSHLTAVSGANCAVVIAIVMAFGGALGLRRRTRVIASLALLGAFVVLVTPGASVLRAAVMAVIVVFSAASGRPARGVPALAAAVIVLLQFDPWLARDYGFVLSVLATAGLLVLAGPLAKALARWMPRSLATLISIPLAAQLACQPVLILLSPSIPLYGVAANMLTEPAAPAATVIGLLACVLLPWLPGVGYACAQVAWVPSAWIAAVATASSNLPASQLPWIGGVAGLVLLAVVTVLVLIVALWSGRRNSLVLKVIAGLCLAMCGAYSGTVIGQGVGRELSIPSQWQIAACDIGQGDAVLVHDGAFHALVDTGPDPKLLSQCLSTLGIDRIDLLVLTHYDLDHIGGVAAVAGRVDTALVGKPDTAGDVARLRPLSQGGATVRQASSGDTGDLGRLSWRIIWPKTGSAQMQSGNPGSVVIEFEGQGIRSVFLGDLGEDAQNALLAAQNPGPVDVVKVAHHGSADQSEDLYRRLSARVGLISVGAHNLYGHPTQRALGMLARVGTSAERTDKQGMILISRGSKPGSINVWSERGG